MLKQLYKFHTIGGCVLLTPSFGTATTKESADCLPCAGGQSVSPWQALASGRGNGIHFPSTRPSTLLLKDLNCLPTQDPYKPRHVQGHIDTQVLDVHIY